MTLTKAIIQKQIDELSRQKQNCISDRTKYENAKAYANKVITNLSNGLKNLTLADDNIKKYFNMNGKTGDSGKISSLKQETTSLHKKMENTILPSIVSKINDLNKQVIQLDAQISQLRKQLQQAE